MNRRLKPMIRTVAAAAVALFIVSSSRPATAQEGRRGRGFSPERQREMIQRYPGIDANNDGSLSFDEIRAFFQAHPELRRDRGGPPGEGPGRGPWGGWERRAREILRDHPDADANHDGTLSPDEARAFFEAHPELRRDRGPDRGPWGDWERRSRELLQQHPEADRNGDGRLSFDESRAFFEANPQLFRQEMLRRNPELDTNKDGQLSEEEFQAARTRFEERRRQDMLRRFPQADTNGDGQLSEEEMRAAREQMMQRWRADLLQRNPDADTDGDGQLSEAEMQALRERFRAGRGQPPAGAPGAPGSEEAPSAGNRPERRDRRASEIGRTERDEWVRYVERFCERYKLDSSQRATAQSILKDFMEQRAKLLAQQQPAAAAPTPGPRPPELKPEVRKALDDLFKQMREKLDQIPTSGQRGATTQPA